MKLDNMEITPFLAESAYSEGKYITTHSGVFHVMYSTAQKTFYPMKVFSPGLAKPGKIEFMTAKEINDRLGYKLLVE